MTAQFVDVSGFQSNIDFHAYAGWSKQGDGISRIAIKATEGIGFVDPLFAAHRAGALSAGIESVLYYHFSRPDLNSNAAAEADFAHSIIGAIRPNDAIVLDYEVAHPAANSEWAYEWLARQEHNYGKPPMIYASDAYIRQRLNDSRLARFPLWLAAWQFTPDARPPCPPPWQHYTYLQYTDRATIPGIAGIVDANISLGGDKPMPATTIPAGWQDNGTILTAPNGVPVVLGFRDYILNHPWEPANWPVATEFGTQQLEMSNPSLGGGSQQLFRWKMLGYTPDRGVFEEWLGQELFVARRVLSALKAPPTDVIALLTTLLAASEQLSGQIQSILKELQPAP